MRFSLPNQSMINSLVPTKFWDREGAPYLSRDKAQVSAGNGSYAYYVTIGLGGIA